MSYSRCSRSACWVEKCWRVSSDPLRVHASFRLQTRTDEGKILKKVAGRAWISEGDHEVIRIEAKLLENFGLGGGILVRLNKGATITFQRRKVNDEIWLPAEAHFTVTGRLLMLKGVCVDVTGEFTDYRKFTVETNVIIRR